MTWRPLLAVGLLYAPVNASQTEWLQGQTSSLKKRFKKSISGKMMRRVYLFVPQLKSVKRLGEKVSVDCQIITSQSTTYPLAAFLKKNKKIWLSGATRQLKVFLTTFKTPKVYLKPCNLGEESSGSSTKTLAIGVAFERWSDMSNEQVPG